MKIAIITNSSSYEPRVDLTAAFFRKKGHQVTRIESDYVHREKIKRECKEEETIYIDTIPYKRNLSLRRLYSHYDFSKKVSEILDSQLFDLLYVIIPANALLKFAAKHKSNNPSILLVADVIDLWPESLPIRFIKRIWPITLWSALRNDNLCKSDYVILECGLYQSLLKRHIKEVDNSVIYWPKKFTLNCKEYIMDEKQLNLCYLGSINNIIDIKFIINLMVELNKIKKTVLHIIGDGENKDKFLLKLSSADIPVIFYGSIYNEHKKMEILSVCDYGLNIMKSSVCVGITMKSVDYMHAGIPMINNIKGDTWDLIESNPLGINCKPDLYYELAKEIVDKRNQMKENRPYIRQLYKDMFSEDAYNSGMEQCLRGLMKDNIEENY